MSFCLSLCKISDVWFPFLTRLVGKCIMPLVSSGISVLSAVKSLSICQLVCKKQKVDGWCLAPVPIPGAQRQKEEQDQGEHWFSFCSLESVEGVSRAEKPSRGGYFSFCLVLWANWESAPTLSRQINVHNINAHNHYWFKMNSLLYHERFITWHDWVCLTLTPLDHEICRLCNKLATTWGGMWQQRV